MRKPGSRGFRAGLTGFSTVRTTDVEENQDKFVLPDCLWVLLSVNPAHVPDDSKAEDRGSTWKTPTGSVMKTVMNGGELPPIVLSPVQSVTSTLLRRAVRSRRCTWNAPRKLLYLASSLCRFLEACDHCPNCCGSSSRRSPGESCCGPWDRFSCDLMLELAEEGSFDEAVKLRSPKFVVQCARRVFGTAKELLIKFHGKELAEIVQAYVAARE